MLCSTVPDHIALFLFTGREMLWGIWKNKESGQEGTLESLDIKRGHCKDKNFIIVEQ